MKFLVLLALVGAAAAQYKLYSGLGYPGYTGLHPGYAGYASTPYAAVPAAYHGVAPTTYAGYNTGYFPYNFSPYTTNYGLPYAFKEAEKPAEVEKPAVESREKRSADEEDQTAEDALLYTTYASHPYTYNYGYPAAAKVYNYGFNTPASTYPLTYAAYNPVTYSNYHYAPAAVHHLKKRDTAAAEEDQQADDALLYSTYAAHPYAYNNRYAYSGFNYPAASVYNYQRPYAYSAYNTAYNTHNAFPFRAFY